MTIMIPFFILGIVSFTAIFFGGIHLWAQSLMIISIFGMTAAALWAWAVNKASKKYEQAEKVILEPVSFAGILFLLWTGLQLIPLPEAVLQFLSPNTKAAWETTGMVGGKGPFPISLYPYVTLNSVIFGIALLLFYWLALYGLQRRNRVHVLISGLLILGTLVGLYALFQAGTGSRYVLWWKSNVLESASGTFINRNHFAAFLSMLICLGIGYIWALGKEEEGGMGWGKSSGTRRVMVLLGVALMMAALLATASRGGVLSLLGALIFMVGMMLARFLRKKSAYAVILLISVVTIYVSYIGIYRVMDRFQYFKSSFQDRMEFIRNTYEMAGAFPLTGGGLGTFESVYPGFQKGDFDLVVDYAHNDWMQLFGETGWPGLILIGGGFVFLLFASLSRWRNRRDPFSVGIGLGGMGAMLSMAIHSLSDFNLHMPANALLMALILAVTQIAFSSRISRGEEQLTFAGWKFNPAAWTATGIAVLATLGGVVLAKQTLWTWRADMMARASENSTLAAAEPKDSDLKKAWSLVPGEATYWAWLAIRESMRGSRGQESINMLWEQGIDSILRAMAIQRNVAHAWRGSDKPIEQAGARQQLFDTNDGIPAKDPDLYLLGEGVKRNPTNWSLWRQMAWTAFCKADQDPKYYYPIALQAMGNAQRFRPHSPQQKLEFGIIGISAGWLERQRIDEASWKQAFQQTLYAKPDWAPGMVDLLIFNLGERGANAVRGLLPDDSRSFVLAGSALARWGLAERGLEILKDGERKKKEEVESLWRVYVVKGGGKYRNLNQGTRTRGSGDGGIGQKGNMGAPKAWIRLTRNPEAEEPEKILREILALDSQHPGGMLARGKTIEALKCQEQRTGRIGDLVDLKKIATALSGFERQKNAPLLEIAYFRAKVLVEAGRPGEAGAQLQQVLRLNPQYFPAWVQMLALVERKGWTALDERELESLRRKVELFQMDRVVADAWRWGGEFEGSPSWVAPVRIAHASNRMTVHFSANEPGLWKLMVDGRFVAAWAGSSCKETTEFDLPAGEHLFRVMWHKDPPRDFNKKVPGKLQIEFSGKGKESVIVKTVVGS